MNYPPPDPQLMQFLLSAYQSHGCSASRQGDWISIKGGRLFTRAASFDQAHHGNAVVLQADFLTVTSAGQHILESFAGWGQDQSSALEDVCHSFLDSTFHAILSVFMGQPSEQAESLMWTIRGIQRKLTFGFVRLRGGFPSDEWPSLFEAVETALTGSHLPSGVHWVRYFYSHLPGQAPVIEALLDNQPWAAMQDQTADFPWPVSDEFYTARLFLIIEDAQVTDTPDSQTK